jgi:acetyl-CoA carboxylase carboxyltransferase component/pyruvate/2-oxoglutarate dehydrogenase complex dihydrolipoamide acyltransferase (E2) component
MRNGEPLPAGARRLEVPVLVDGKGSAWAPGALDVTLRLQGRLVVAETPPPGLSAERRRAVLATAAGLGQARGVAGAVTVTFVADPASGEIRFLETVPRLPEAYAAVESLTGLDLAALQVHLSRGGTLDGEPPEPRGHAFQVCLSARDPEAGFAPSPGTVEILRLPAGAGLRADPVLDEGDTLPGEGDPAIVRLTAWGRTRNEALLRSQRGLARTVAIVRGGGTDKAFLAEVLDRLEVEGSAADPTWIERLVASGGHLPGRGADAALLAAAVATYESELDEAKSLFYVSAVRGRPEVPREIGRAIELWHRNHAYLFHVSRLGPRHYRMEAGGRRIEVRIEPPARTGRRLTCGGRSWHTSVSAQGRDLLVEIDGIPHRVSRDAGSVVRSPAPAVVVSLAVQEGETVDAGQPLAVLEAMKVETSVLAPAAGRVRKLLVRRNAQVGTGAPLLILEPVLPADTPAAGERIRLDGLAAASGGDPLEEVRRLMLGYDVEPRAVQLLLAGSAPGNDEARTTDNRKEDDLLRTFVDFGSLFHRRHDEEAAGGEAAGRHTAEDYLFTYLRDLGARGAGLPPVFLAKLRRALGHYGVLSLDRTPELEESLFRVAVSHQRMTQQVPPVLALLERRLENPEPTGSEDLREILERLIVEAQGHEPAVYDLARELRFRSFDEPVLLAARERILAAAEADLSALAAGPDSGSRDGTAREAHIRSLVECPQPLHEILSRRFASAPPGLRQAMLEVMLRRYYRIRNLGEVTRREAPGFEAELSFAAVAYEHRGVRVDVFATHTEPADLPRAAAAVRRLAEELPPASPEIHEENREIVADLYSWDPEPAEDDEATALRLAALVEATGFPAPLSRIAFALNGPAGGRHFTFRRDPSEDAFTEERLSRGIHPMLALRLQLWRLANFRLERLPAARGIHLFHGIALENPRDERLFALAEVRDLTPVRDADGRIAQFPQLEHTLMEALAGMRRFQSRRPAGQRLHWNRVLLAVWPPVDLDPDELNGMVRRLAPLSEGLGLEKVVVRCRIPDRDTGELRDVVMEIINPDEGFTLRFRRPAETPLKPLREYARKVIELRRRGLVYPYEIVRSLAPRRGETQAELPAGDFVEHDLDASDDANDTNARLVPVDRPSGGNTANIVAGVIRSFTDRYPEGMTRVILLGDPSRGMGSLAEPECRRILAALDLAERMGVPLEWFAVSAGARISMDSGTENMDWIALVLRRLVRFTQAGGEVNIVVPGINVGAQPYWNAEATMLMHTRGIVIMTPEGAMVLTGKQALDYSGGVSAEDNQGIGGYERIMGPNGQAQYAARDLGDACRILMRHYEHTWTAPGERFPRPAPTADPRDRDIRPFPHGGDFRTVGEVFSEATNPGRKKPFEIRRAMSAVIDQDHPPLERWYGMRDAEIAVVWDAHLGGHPVCLLGFESKPLPRLGFAPVFGPDHWTGGTLFPLAAKKVARAINAASNNRPLVVLANLSGFDGSPESMRQGQLEYGAEIGRAVVGFQGPIVFCVVSRYHGGAFVVFSRALHDNMEVAALEGTHASVIGGAPAAAVIFAREVDQRTRRDPRIVDLEKQITDPATPDKGTLRARLEELLDAVRSEKLGEVAEEFDHIHSIERAQRVGSIHHILPPERLRPYLIEAVERGMEKELRQNSPASPD